MAPKKKAGGKDGPAKMADKENLARAEAEVLSLQHILEQRSHEVGAWVGLVVSGWVAACQSTYAGRLALLVFSCAH